MDLLGPAIEGLLNAYLPSLLLVLLMALVPPILRKLTAREGYPTNVQTERTILWRFYLFLVINVFLVTTLAGSVLGKLEDILSGDDSIPELLASSLPNQGPFFIEYLMVKLCYVTMDLLRPHILLLYVFRAAGRPAAAYDFTIESRPTLDYGPRYGWDLLVVVLAMTYSIMYPFILIFAIGYFVVVAIVHRHNLIYQHRPRVELQGQLWPRVLTLYFVAVLVFQWTMVGLFSLQQSPALVFPVLGTVFLAFAWYRIARLTPQAPDLLAWTWWRDRSTCPSERTWLLAAPGERPGPPAPPPPSAVNDADEMERGRDPVAGASAGQDDALDGLTHHGRFTAAEVSQMYFVDPRMHPPPPRLVDDPYNAFLPQL